MLYKAIIESLSTVPFHEEGPLERLKFCDDPTIVVHKFSGVSKKKRNYSKIHSHTHEEEYNIFLGKKFEVEVIVGDKLYIINEPTMVYLAPGVIHSANIISGSGNIVILKIKK